MTRASAATGAGQSTLSRQLAALELHLGCKLFLPHAEHILQAAADARDLLHEGGTALTGRMRVACSIAVARRLVIPALPRWQSLHPNLALDLAISDCVASIIEDQIDVALRAGPLTNSSMIARPVGLSRRVAVASADYLRGRQAPAQPEDLKRHDCIVFSGAAHPHQWDFSNAAGTVSVKVSSRLAVSTVDALYDAARAGLGIAVMPSWCCRDALHDGSLVRVLSDYQLPTQTIYAVTLAKPRAGAKVHAFMQFAERLLKNTSSV